MTKDGTIRVDRCLKIYAKKGKYFLTKKKKNNKKLKCLQLLVFN